MQKHFSKLESLKKYLIASLILAIPLYPKFPLFPIPGTYVSIRLEDFLISLTLFAFLFSGISDRKFILKDRVFLSIFMYLGVGVLSLISSILITQTVVPKLGFLHWIRRVEYLSMFFVGYSYLKHNPRSIHFFMKLLPIVVIIDFIYGLGQRYFTWPIIITQNEEYAKGVALRYIEGSHINSTFAGHYDLATYLVFTLPLILSLVIYSKKISTFYLLVYTSGLWLLVNTASRISLVSFIGAATLSLILLKKFRKGFALIVLSILFIGFSSNLITRYQRVIRLFSEQVKRYTLEMVITPVYAEEGSVMRRETAVATPTPIPVFEDRSTSIRLNVEWPRALRALSKNPLLGTGYSSITLATDNDYLRMLGETGIIGFSSFFLILANLLKKLLKYLKTTKIRSDLESVYILSFAGGFMGILINAVFIDVFEASKFAITLWLVLGMLYGKITTKENEL